MVLFLWWCGGVFCGGVNIRPENSYFTVFRKIVVMWCCGGVVVVMWWCGGVFVVVFLWWCFLWWCFVVVVWCFCGGVVVFLWSHRVVTHRVLA